MKQVIVSHPSGILQGDIYLEGSKSIANRVLIIQALSGKSFPILNLPSCDDTRVMLDAFSSSKNHEINVGLAGTAGRFLSAYFAFQAGTQRIQADEGLRVRPMGPLIEVLQEIGANVESQEGDDRFPLIFHPFEGQKKREVYLTENISSQFISALLLVAPSLPEGLRIHMPKQQKSMSYIRMTLEVMKYFGVDVGVDEDCLDVVPQTYHGREVAIEADWSSASYFFGLAALSKEADIRLFGLVENSWQGDKVIAEASSSLGLHVQFFDGYIQVRKLPDGRVSPVLNWDFSDNPDLFQTLATVAAALQQKGVFTGMETLAYKETNRLKAMQNELEKCGVFIHEMPKRFSPKSGRQIFLLDGEYHHPSLDQVFQTYGDHRMAMALSILALKGEIAIENPGVVSKSYHGFWEDLKKLGFVIQ